MVFTYFLILAFVSIDINFIKLLINIDSFQAQFFILSNLHCFARSGVTGTWAPIKFGRLRVKHRLKNLNLLFRTDGAALADHHGLWRRYGRKGINFLKYSMNFWSQNFLRKEKKKIWTFEIYLKAEIIESWRNRSSRWTNERGNFFLVFYWAKYLDTLALVSPLFLAFAESTGWF